MFKFVSGDYYPGDLGFLKIWGLGIFCGFFTPGFFVDFLSRDFLGMESFFS